MAESTDNSTDKRLENLQPPWKPGQSGNPTGKARGQRDYATLYKEALIKLAKKNNLEPDDLELEILSNAILNARVGNYKFYKDMMDRLFGKALQRSQVDGNITVNYEEMNDEQLDAAIREKARKAGVDQAT